MERPSGSADPDLDTAPRVGYARGVVEADAAAPSFWARRGVLVAWLAGVGLSLPALAAGAFSDDFMQHLVLEGTADLPNGPATLYDFTRGGSALPLIERGYVPWQAHPELSMRFLRPLSSLSIALDHALFGRSQLLGHLVNVGWFLGLLAIAIAWFRRVLPPSRAGLASVLYAVAGGHAMNLGWVATRHLLVGGVFAALAIWLHLRWREPADTDRHRIPEWAHLVLLALGLLSSESSLSALAFIAAYEALGCADSVRSRVRAAAPALLLGVAYLSTYAALGLGTRHSGLYLSPFSQPVLFAKAALTRWPVLAGEMFSAVPSTLWGQAPKARPVLVGIAFLFAALVAGVLRGAGLERREQRQLRWLAAGAVLATLPMVGGVIDGRLLAVPLLGAAPVVATAIEAGWSSGKRTLKLAAGTLAGLHLGLAALVRVGLTLAMVQLSRAQQTLATTADLSACPDGASALVVTGADPSLSLSGGASLVYYRPETYRQLKRFSVLSMAPQDQILEGVGPRSFILEVAKLPRRKTIFESVFGDEPALPGKIVDLDYLRAEVLAVDAGLPTRVRFRVPESSCLLVLTDGHLTSRGLPKPGETLIVPHEPGPMGL